MSIPKIIEAWKHKPFEDLLIELYIDKDMTIPEISDYLHISVGAVHSYLSKFNIYKEKLIWNTVVNTDKKGKRK